jgi:hypothetical protein
LEREYHTAAFNVVLNSSIFILRGLGLRMASAAIVCASFGAHIVDVMVMKTYK